MNTTFQRIWKDNYRIHSYEADMSGRATVPALLQFMQESAWNHAEHLELGYSHLIKKNLAWVMARLSLHIQQLPIWGDDIYLETWPSERDKLFAYRDFRLTTDTDEVLALGTTTWLVIDIQSRRPQRTESYFHIPDWEFHRALPGFAPKVPAPQHIDTTTERRVFFSHLDVNGHVNNVKYLEYFMDSFPTEFLQQHQLVQADLNFIAEALVLNEVLVQTQQLENSTFVQRLIRKQGAQELCRAKTMWQPLP